MIDENDQAVNGDTKAIDDDDDDVDVDKDTSCEDSEDEDPEQIKTRTWPVARTAVAQIHGSNKLLKLEFLAQGAYHYVWLLTFSTSLYVNDSSSVEERKIILRTPKSDILQPYKIRQEAACLKYLAENKPSIPAPRLFAWDDGTSDSATPFIAEEFIEGQRLSVVWPQLNEQEKFNIIREIASVIADLGETRFQCIGGVSKDSPAGPSVESVNVFNGWEKFYSPDCYNLGPYLNSKDYIISCYDREIYYYTHAESSDIIEEAFERTTVADFVTELKAERQALLNDIQNQSLFQAIDAEPLVLVHGDFHAGNMLTRNGRLVGVVDWEFSSAYPLSELFGVADIIQVSLPGRTEATEEEEMEWHDRYLKEFEKIVRQRGWSDEDFKAASGKGHKILREARAIMFPRDSMLIDTESATG